MLILSRKVDEKIIINDEIEVTVVGVEGGQVQLGIEAPDEVEIHREEVYRRIERENIEAVVKQGIDLGILKKVDVEGKEDD